MLVKINYLLPSLWPLPLPLQATRLARSLFFIIVWKWIRWFLTISYNASWWYYVGQEYSTIIPVVGQTWKDLNIHSHIHMKLKLLLCAFGSLHIHTLCFQREHILVLSKWWWSTWGIINNNNKEIHTRRDYCSSYDLN